jgi:hypothetical protein
MSSRLSSLTSGNIFTAEQVEFFLKTDLRLTSLAEVGESGSVIIRSEMFSVTTGEPLMLI